MPLRALTKRGDHGFGEFAHGIEGIGIGVLFGGIGLFLLGMLLMALSTQYIFDGVRVGILERVGA